jgi:hypothetical protein
MRKPHLCIPALIWIFTEAILISCLPVNADISIQKIQYNGWNNCWRMSNGVVDLVVVPQIGRIMRYGMINKRNILWEAKEEEGKTNPPQTSKSWVNFGGDKLWVAPQSIWGWPPDPWLDSGSMTVKILPGHRLLLTGQESPITHVRFSREIILAPKGTDVTFVNRMKNIGKQHVKWGIWQITQVNGDGETTLYIDKHSRFKGSVYKFKNMAPDSAHLKISHGMAFFRLHPGKNQKIGSDSTKGLIIGRWPDYTFTIFSAYHHGLIYPDMGCGQEIYSSDTLNYVEMESLSPIYSLSPGKQARFVTRWTLKSSHSK